MKKYLLLSLAFILAGFTLQAQTAVFQAKKQTGNFEVQELMSSFNQRTNIGTVDLRKVRNGRNHLLTDRRNGRMLMMLATRVGSRVRIDGFMVQTKDGRYIKLPEQTTGKPDPGGIGCPDNWNATLVCYTHPTYKVKVCYVRCTPTQITLAFPPGL